MEDINCWEEKFEMCGYAARLLDKVTHLNKLVRHPIDIREVKKGIYYARKYHGAQMRQSGDPYYSHPVEVAYMVAEYTANKDIRFYTEEMIITSLLHDTVEDTALTEKIIAVIFGKEIAKQVEALTRIKPYGKISSAEMLNLLMLEINEKALIIKFFDRVHNMQTLGAKSAEKIKKITDETLSSFLLLAVSLGARELEQELVRLCFKHYEIENYAA